VRVLAQEVVHGLEAGRVAPLGVVGHEQDGLARRHEGPGGGVEDPVAFATVEAAGTLLV
jgi:hypothetical protein